MNLDIPLSFESSTEVTNGERPEPFDYLQSVPTRDTVSDSLFHELVSTAAFRRLADIRFLGGIDYFLVRYPNGAPGNRRYTRLQHSLGVAKLAKLYADIKGLSPKEGRLAWAAALLHDIGHAPLSHTLESAFKRSFGIDHHIAGADIILGRSPYGREIINILSSHGLDPEEVLSIANGQSERFDGFFNGPINFDTIEGILRSWTYVKPHANALSPERVVLASYNRSTPTDMQIVDRFWEYKDHAYRFIVRSEFGVASDYLCESLVLDKISCLDRDDYFLTEKQIFKKLPDLKMLLLKFKLHSRAARSSTQEIPYKARLFSVDHRFDFYSRDDKYRYTQRKENRVMKAPSPTTADDLPCPSIPDFFHDLDLRQNY
ncbi:HD domain-containing protein [Acetobacter papayae]|uniref:HD domain-containing protein n=1 Tax=Acetobacter papayae TaxID=1076592 RepID=UPI000B069CE2|nr:HD domain-containing protein [Acetobacter papayae]